MIFPDTNVISESIRNGGDHNVVAWIDGQPQEELFLATPVLAELLFGTELLPDGARKTRLAATIAFVVGRRFAARIRPFDERAAREYARIMAAARRAGYAISVMDGQIAAIAAAHRATVATRDTAPFAAAGVTTIDPWHPRA